MFLILKDTYFPDYADDSTPFLVVDNTIDVVKALGKISANLIKWVLNNLMKVHTVKCHLLLNIQEPGIIKITNLCINNSFYEKSNGIKINQRLKLTNLENLLKDIKKIKENKT